MGLGELIILAGGFATRLGSQTYNVPKILLPFHGKEFLNYQLELYDGKFNSITYALGHKSDVIIDHLSTIKCRSRLGFCIDPYPGCGTGAALRNAVAELQSEFFAVTYGDSYLLHDPIPAFQDFIRRNENAAMLVTKSTGTDINNVQVSDGKVVKYQKNSNDLNLQNLDYGLSFFKKSSMSQFDIRGAFDLSEYHQRFIAMGQLKCYEVGERYFEIGSLKGQRDFEKYLEMR